MDRRVTPPHRTRLCTYGLLAPSEGGGKSPNKRREAGELNLIVYFFSAHFLSPLPQLGTHYVSFSLLGLMLNSRIGRVSLMLREL